MRNCFSMVGGGGKLIDSPLDRIYCLLMDNNYFSLLPVIYNLQSFKAAQRK